MKKADQILVRAIKAFPKNTIILLDSGEAYGAYQATFGEIRENDQGITRVFVNDIPVVWHQGGYDKIQQELEQFRYLRHMVQQMPDILFKSMKAVGEK